MSEVDYVNLFPLDLITDTFIRLKSPGQWLLGFSGLSAAGTSCIIHTSVPKSRTDCINLLSRDILIDIFSRLPVKSIGQCKCVSKSWGSLLSNPDFIRTHLTRSSGINLVFISGSDSPNPGVLYSTAFNNNYYYDYYNPNCRRVDIFSKMEVERAMKTELNFNRSNKWSRIWGSCDGLILVEDDCENLFLLNPTTLKSQKLPFLPSGYRNNFMFGLGYDYSCDDYAVVAVTYHNGLKIDAQVYVHMLKKNYWKKVGSYPYYHDKYQTRVAGIFLRGSLHWLAKNSSTIAAFNIADKELSGLPLPKWVSGLSFDLMKLGVLKGCLCLFSEPLMGKTELYVLMEYGVMESWIRFSVVLFDVSNVSQLNFREDSSALLRSDQGVLLVSNAKFNYDSDVNFQVGMTFLESFVSPKKTGAEKNSNRGRRSEPIQRRYRDDNSGWLQSW